MRAVRILRERVRVGVSNSGFAVMMMMVYYCYYYHYYYYYYCCYHYYYYYATTLATTYVSLPSLLSYLLQSIFLRLTTELSYHYTYTNNSYSYHNCSSC